MTRERLNRRQFGAILGGTAASLAFGAACAGSQGHDGRILARPLAGTKTSAFGTHALGLGGRRDAILQLPAKPAPGALPLLVLLHGAGGAAAGILRRLGTFADEAGLVVLAPDSRESSWDVIGGEFGPDVTFINRALERAFQQVAVDPARISIGGFSDGATYALSLGLTNGDLFRRIAAFSPGFVVQGQPQGNPSIFVSHGKADDILPIDRCSRRIVPTLKKRGCEVTYREFEGGHTVPPDLAREGLLFVSGRAA